MFFVLLQANSSKFYLMLFSFDFTPPLQFQLLNKNFTIASVDTTVLYVVPCLIDVPPTPPMHPPNNCTSTIDVAVI